MEQAKRLSFLSSKEQEHILMNVIAQKQYDRIVTMSRNGFKMTPLILETLLRSGQKDVITTILNENFIFDGDFEYLRQLLEEVISPNVIGQFLIRKANEETNINMKSRWRNLCSSVSTTQLAEHNAWDLLIQQKKWDTLAENGHFDDIINLPTQCYSQKAAEVLEKHNMYNRIVELGRFGWLAYMSEGAKILAEHKQFRILFENRKHLKKWNENDVYDFLLKTPEAIEFLYKEYPQNLLMRGYYKIFKQNKDWKFLAKNECYHQIDWIQWREQIKNERPHDMELFLISAAKAKRWEILAEEGQWLTLLRNLQFGLALRCLGNSKASADGSCCHGRGHAGDDEV